MAGNSALGAAQQVCDQILTAAADILGVPVEGLDLSAARSPLRATRFGKPCALSGQRTVCLRSRQKKSVAWLMTCLRESCPISPGTLFHPLCRQRVQGELASRKCRQLLTMLLRSSSLCSLSSNLRPLIECELLGSGHSSRSPPSRRAPETASASGGGFSFVAS